MMPNTEFSGEAPCEARPRPLQLIVLRPFNDATPSAIDTGAAPLWRPLPLLAGGLPGSTLPCRLVTPGADG
jgi:hypothetical protein